MGYTIRINKMLLIFVKNESLEGVNLYKICFQDVLNLQFEVYWLTLTIQYLSTSQ